MVKGIIRRLDDLGRVVIPKEYRKMYNIQLGDPMEIYALDNGDIVVRKVNLSSQLEQAATPIIEAVAENTGKTVLFSDLSVFLNGAGEGRNRLIRREVPQGICSALKDGKVMSTTTANDISDVALEESGFDYFSVVPITANSETRGGLYLLSNEPVTEVETLLLKTVAAIISKSLLKI